MAFSFDRDEYHKICNKIYDRAVKFLKNNLPEALRFNDVQTLLDIYIKLFRAKAKIAVDDLSTYDRRNEHLERLLNIMKHFLSMNECFDFLKVRCEILQREVVFSSGEETDGEYDDDSGNSSTDEDYVESDVESDGEQSDLGLSQDEEQSDEELFD